jgi:hypothetical protein
MILEHPVTPTYSNAVETPDRAMARKIAFDTISRRLGELLKRSGDRSRGQWCIGEAA